MNLIFVSIVSRNKKSGCAHEVRIASFDSPSKSTTRGSTLLLAGGMLRRDYIYIFSKTCVSPCLKRIKRTKSRMAPLYSSSKVAYSNVSSDFSCGVPFTSNRRKCAVFTYLWSREISPAPTKATAHTKIHRCIWHGKAHVDDLSGCDNRTFSAVLVPELLSLLTPWRRMDGR